MHGYWYGLFAALFFALAALFLALFTLALIASLPSHAQSPWPEMPPAQYNHPYSGHLVIKRGSPPEIHLWCHSFFARACAVPGNGTCTVYLPTPTPGGAPQIYAALAIHEIAHCNGWRHR